MINLDFDNNKRFAHNNLYWNYRLSGLQASLGISQLKQINKTINKKINKGYYSNYCLIVIIKFSFLLMSTTV